MREQRECIAVELRPATRSWTDPYDHIVLVKVALSLVAPGLGVANKGLRYRPDRDTNSLTATVAFEAVPGVLVLALLVWRLIVQAASEARPLGSIGSDVSPEPVAPTPTA